MLKKIIIFSFIFSFYILNLFSDIIFRQAVINDIDAISFLYFSIRETDDANNLVLCPTSEMQRAKNAKEIENGQLFVSQDLQTSEIVGIIKLYLLDPLNINNLKKIQDCLIYELGCDSDHIAFLSSVIKDSIYFYYGGAFTKKEYRGRGLNFSLINYAYNFLKESILEKNRRYFVLMYGQVEANKRHFCPLKGFESFIKSFGFNNFDLKFKTFKSYKPVFRLKGENYELVPDYINGLGQGCLAVFDKTKAGCV